jgi:hypothetical protein
MPSHINKLRLITGSAQAASSGYPVGTFPDVSHLRRIVYAVARAPNHNFVPYPRRRKQRQPLFPNTFSIVIFRPADIIPSPNDDNTS